MKNKIESSGGKKMKIVGISIGVILVTVAAILSALSFSRKSSLYQSTGMKSYEMSMDAGYGGEDDFSSRSSAVMNQKDMAFSPMSESIEVVPPEASDKRVIKNGDLTMKVDSMDWSLGEISEIARNNGGDIFSSNVSQTKNNVKSGNIVVKVPVYNFEKTFLEIKTKGVLVTRESTSGKDVTEQYQDIEGRIKNKQVEEEAYQKILESAQKISDIIEVTEALSRVRSQIESYQGQLKFLASQTEMSTIRVNLSEDQNITVIDSWRPLQVAKDAVNSLIKSMQGFADFVIVSVIVFLPMAALYSLIAFLVYFFAKSIYGKLRKNDNVELKK
jgi:hypothetical protein